jgi:glutamate transport system permease protein
MTAQASVLYDHPGPKAKARYRVLSVLFTVLLALLLWWVLATLNSKQELTAAKWKPFTTADVWSNFLWLGLWGTIKAAVLSVVIALPIGAIFAVGRLSDHVWLRWPCAVVVEFFRAIPVLLLMFFALQFYINFTDVPSDIRPLYAVVTGLVLYNGSVLAEIFRSGIQSLPKGQTEASMAIGLRKTQMMTSILLPQALTAMLPAVVSQLVVVLKDTALGGVLLGYTDLMRQANTLTANFSNSVATYTVIAVLYISMNLILSLLARRLEQWMRRRRGQKPAAIEPETLAPGLQTGAAV